MIKKAIIIFLIAIITINITILTASFYVTKPIIIKVSDYAMVFAHGQYASTLYKDINQTYIIHYHYTISGKNTIPTRDLINNLKSRGYNRIWLSQCHTGDFPYSYYNQKTKEKVAWDESAIINNKEGVTIPIFYGFGFYKLIYS